MIAVLQRVTFASVVVDGECIAKIDKGLLVFLAVEKSDKASIVKKMAEKILKYRVFADDKDKMNLSMLDICGSILVVPQFTLAADTQKGLRPSFSKAADVEKGLALFGQLVDIMRVTGESMVDDLAENWLQTGRFGADMAVELLNDGPVTFTLSM